MRPRLVLVGGGHAHLAVLRALAQAPDATREVVLVTPSTRQVYSGMLPGWLAGQYPLAACCIALEGWVQAAGVQMIQASVVGLDAAARQLTLSNGATLGYDTMSLDIGSLTDTTDLQALGQRLLPVKPLASFVARWPGVLAAARQQAAYRLVVVGAGAAGVELALAARHALAQTGTAATVTLVAGLRGLLPNHAASVQQRVRRQLALRGVGWVSARACGVADGLVLDTGALLEADVVLAATGARAPDWLKGSGLVLSAQGYVQVDAGHRSVSHPDVFAAGDCCARDDPALQRSGVHAVRAGPVLARNLLSPLGAVAQHEYAPRRRSLYLLACGPRYAVASWGTWSWQGAWVWRWKDWIDQRFVRRHTVAGATARCP